MKRSLLRTGIIVMALVALLAPLAVMICDIEGDQEANDAAHVVAPMIRLLAQSPASQANVLLEPVMEIEDAWAIEDTRQEAESPLVIGMRNGDSALGYDAESQTFYCSIGTDFEEDAWPALDLYVQGAAEQTTVRAAWIDDYSYDYPAEAVQEGWTYELIAYTEETYQYFSIVFTGLPIVTLKAEEEIDDEYVPACVSVSSAEDTAITSMAQVHLRGGGYGKPIDKRSYRVEFRTLTRTGRSAANEISVLGMEADSDWLLLANAQNPASVHNYLAYDLWNRWDGEEHLLMQMDSRMVELFVGDEYMGLYQLMQRVDVQKEIEAAGGSLTTDSAVRIIAPYNLSEKPIDDISAESPSKAEYLYAPGGEAQKAFDAFENYARLMGWLEEEPLSDEAFISLAEQCVDVESFMSYFLFLQAAGLQRDNVRNNLYVYMMADENGQLRYHLAPWDMDCAFCSGDFWSDISTGYRFNMHLTIAVRMLDLNVMNCREILHAMYQEKRATMLSDEAIEAWITSAEREISASGAYERETERWYESASSFDLSDLLSFEKEQIVLIGENIEEKWPLTGADE